MTRRSLRAQFLLKNRSRLIVQSGWTIRHTRLTLTDMQLPVIELEHLTAADRESL